jgi:hypothetical protein
VQFVTVQRSRERLIEFFHFDGRSHTPDTTCNTHTHISMYEYSNNNNMYNDQVTTIYDYTTIITSISVISITGCFAWKAKIKTVRQKFVSRVLKYNLIMYILPSGIDRNEYL